MWMIKAGTTILIDAPFGKIGGPRSVPSSDGLSSVTDTAPWKAYVTPEDRFYEKEQVWDTVRVHNNQHTEDIPYWISHNIELLRGAEVIVQCKGKWARVKRSDIEYLD
jgi:hypothetical protein